MDGSKRRLLKTGGFSLAWLLAFTVSFAPLASHVVGLLYSPDARDTARRVRHGVGYQ